MPSDVLNPQRAWTDKSKYEAALGKLGRLFIENFEQFKCQESDEIIGAGPVV